jgi:hypothetical protein
VSGLTRRPRREHCVHSCPPEFIGDAPCS